DLPEPAAGTVYQLWAMRDGTPVPAGLLDDGQRLVAEDYRPGEPSVVAWQQHERAVRAEAVAEEAEVVARLLTDPATTVVRDDVTGGGSAVALLGSAQAALLVEDLPEPAAGTVYQLWAMRDGTPVPAGLLDDGQRLVAEDYRPGDGLALSLEPDGGSAQPTTEPVVVLLPG
ncbi:anti-sigma factor, partial [Cellulomonas sp. APG4]|uniref:anti-sigma factor n=1 Tax=Cellulomonas sp. APG4 TaxID=1538656 RepID=UPI00137AD808